MSFVMTKNAGKDKRIREDSSAEVPLAETGLKTPLPAAAEKMRSEMNSLIRDLKMEQDVSVETIRKGIVITMKENVTFRPGEAEILKDSGPVLDNIAGIIRRHPSYAVEIDGHTDNVPIKSRLYPSNWELSVARAASVLRYFIGVHGIDPSHLSIKGNADHRPVAPNDTPEQRAQNRRVEIRLRELEVDQ
jgi:chemotaxis protein MotB